VTAEAPQDSGDRVSVSDGRVERIQHLNMKQKLRGFLNIGESIKDLRKTVKGKPRRENYLKCL
jgi:hypothetical protein